MPDIDGIEASRKIKKINKDVPIVAATSLSYETFNNELKKRGSDNDFTAYTNKTVSSNILMRSIAKLILDYDDDFAYLGSDKDKIFKRICPDSCLCYYFYNCNQDSSLRSISYSIKFDDAKFENW